MIEYSTLLKKFSPQADANPWNRRMEPKSFPPSLPHQVAEISADGTTTELVFSDYATLYDWHEQRTRLGLEEFSSFVQRYRTEPVGA